MAGLEGLRVLVVEDELLVAMSLEEVLRAAGCVVVGPIPRVEKALKAARDEAIDIALLDVNLAGERVYPVAEVLTQRRVPFLFMTGYGRDMLPAEHAGRPVVGKPFKLAQVINWLSTAVGAPGQSKPGDDSSPADRS